MYNLQFFMYLILWPTKTRQELENLGNEEEARIEPMSLDFVENGQRTRRHLKAHSLLLRLNRPMAQLRWIGPWPGRFNFVTPAPEPTHPSQLSSLSVVKINPSAPELKSLPSSWDIINVYNLQNIAWTYIFFPYNLGDLCRACRW